jgi:hypothetical protein
MKYLRKGLIQSPGHAASGAYNASTCDREEFHRQVV